MSFILNPISCILSLISQQIDVCTLQQYKARLTLQLRKEWKVLLKCKASLNIFHQIVMHYWPLLEIMQELKLKTKIHIYHKFQTIFQLCFYPKYCFHNARNKEFSNLASCPRFIIDFTKKARNQKKITLQVTFCEKTSNLPVKIIYMIKIFTKSYKQTVQVAILYIRNKNEKQTSNFRFMYSVLCSYILNPTVLCSYSCIFIEVFVMQSVWLAGTSLQCPAELNI